MRALALCAFAAGCLTYGAPAATAGVNLGEARCDLRSFAQEPVSGGQDTYAGAAYGYSHGYGAVSVVSVRCFVKVDGTEVASTPTGSGEAAAVTAGQVRYTAGDLQQVDLCAAWTAGTYSDTVCVALMRTQLPPQALYDAVDTASAYACRAVNAAGDPADVCRPYEA